MALACSLAVGGCSAPSYVSEELQSVADAAAVMQGVEEPQANERDYLFQDYDVKEIERPAGEELPTLDFAGPDNCGVTYEQTGYVDNPVSDDYAVDPNAPKIYLCPGHDKDPDQDFWMATTESNESKVQAWMQKHTVTGKAAKKDDKVILKSKRHTDAKFKKYQKALNFVCNAHAVKIKAMAEKWKNDGTVCKAYPRGEKSGSAEEYSECYDIASLIKQKLEVNKCYVMICKSKKDDKPMSDKSKAKDAAENDCDIIIALHECGVSGKYQVTYKSSGDAKKAAENISIALGKGGYEKNGGPKKVSRGSDNPLHGWSSIAAITVDFGKLSADLTDDRVKDSLANAVVQGIAESYSLEDK